MTEIKRGDIWVEHIRRPCSPVNEADLGVRMTHTPSGKMVEATSSASRLQNTADALDSLRRLLDDEKGTDMRIDKGSADETVQVDVGEQIIRMPEPPPRLGYEAVRVDGRAGGGIEQVLEDLNDRDAEIVAVIPLNEGRAVLVIETEVP